MVNNSVAIVRPMSSIPGLGRYPGVGNGNPLQYSCLGNPMERGTWQATVPGVAKCWTQLSNFALALTKPETCMQVKRQQSESNM